MESDRQSEEEPFSDKVFIFIIMSTLLIAIAGLTVIGVLFFGLVVCCKIVYGFAVSTLQLLFPNE